MTTMRLAALVLALALPGAAAAQAYPSKAVRFVVPFPPGNAGDLMARMLAEKLSVTLKNPIMRELQLPYPRKIEVALPANARCGIMQPSKDSASELLHDPLELLDHVLEPVRRAHAQADALPGAGAVERLVELLEEELLRLGRVARVAPAQPHAPVGDRVE